MTTSAEIRRRLVDALRLDLVGPDHDDASHRTEVLRQSPSKWYLTGFLAPRGASADARSDDTSDEQIDEVEKRQTLGDDEHTPDTPAARKVFFPSSMGLSIIVPKNCDPLSVTVRWATYHPTNDSDEDASESNLRGLLHMPWQRTPHEQTLSVPVRDGTHAHPVPDSGGLHLVVSAREVKANGIPTGARSVSVFLVNERKPAPDARRDEGYVFQTELIVHSACSLVPRPDMRGQYLDDWDEKVADLQYRDTFEFVVGHNVSVTALVNESGACQQVSTVWVPEAEVERMEPTPLAGVDLSMEALAEAASVDQVRSMVGGITAEYAKWLDKQAELIPENSARAEVARELLQNAKVVLARIDDGLACLQDPVVLEAFRVANRAMAMAARQRFSVEWGGSPDELEPPKWRLFQLAFVLMNLRGLADPKHADRELVDLLFFATGGGKTEAYLGLAAFTLVLRRMRNPGVASAGLSVLMRYTLRLLTLDQLGRAATLMCALEILRQDDVEKLGPWPFEVGLWVGQAATPNRMGRKGDKDQHAARARTIAFQNDEKRKPSPIPLENCPWCGAKFTSNSFQLRPDTDRPTELKVSCTSRRCRFKGDNYLPIVAVDEPLYRRLPCFVIATADKFAGLPWVGQTGALFGRVDRHDAAGFYGPCDPGLGRPLPQPLLPPDLIIQDELHLISGPLGTMAGLYESAIEALCTREVDGKTVRPKIVASTATVRRASKQIQALFGRAHVDIFPPPGVDRRDSFFATTRPASEKNARLYVGVAAQGHSLKKVLLRSYLALAGAAQKDWNAAGGDKNPKNPADPYMTLVGYFSSLRELGGSRRIVEDEVNTGLRAYGSRRRVGEAEGSFAKRKISDVLVELTSRVPTNEVADTKRRLGLAFSDKERVDVALATNMISVGLDIIRLGLMVVLGQPKTAAEYIQATSRVGRDEERPGLVVTLLNVHRPRDRSHFERFENWHRSFYRAVEATSVTPFSPRALDRGLGPVTVALARLGHAEMTAPTRAIMAAPRRLELDFVADMLAKRAERHDKDHSDIEGLRQKVKKTVKDILDTWEQLAAKNQQTGSGLQYQTKEATGRGPALLWDPMDPELARQPPEARKFKAPRSLRDVEPSTNLWVRNPDGFEVESEDQA